MMELLKTPTLFLLNINYLHDNVICDIVDSADDNTLHSKCDQASELWKLKLASQLESDLQDTVDWNRTVCPSRATSLEPLTHL